MLLERDVLDFEYSPRTVEKPNARWEGLPLEDMNEQLFESMDSFPYWVNNFVYIQDKKLKSWIPFQLWELQEQAAITFQTEQKVVVLKARQLGFTWLAACYAVWHMLFDPIAEILVFSKTEREAKDILKRMKGIYERLPDFMKCESSLIDRKLEWQLSNNSRVSVLPSNAGDSYAATLILFDEADHVEDFGALFNRAKPAVEGGGKVFVISTSDKDKPDSAYKTVFTSARNGETDFVDVFIPWYAHPDRDLEWYEKTKKEYITQNGSDDDFQGHYPASPVDALKSRSLDKFFPPFWIGRAYDKMKPLFVLGHPDYEKTPEPEGLPPIVGLIVYQAPEPGKSYILGCDPAEGGKKSNDSAITVLDARTFIEVAHISGRIDASTTGEYCHAIAQWYNDCPILVERNNHGHTVIFRAEQLGAFVLYGLDNKPGWLTNSVGKPRMYDWALDTFRDWACIVRTEKTMLQLSSIERATLSAPDNMMDDCSDSFCLALTGVLFREAYGGFVG